MSSLADATGVGQQQPAYAASANSQALRKNVSDYNRTVVEGAAAGAALGAAFGGIFGKKGDKAETAAAGAAIGAASGAAIGYGLASSKQQQIAVEDDLDAKIAAAGERNDKLEQIVETAETLVAEREEQLEGLKSAETSEKQRFRKIVRDDSRTIEEALKRADEDLAYLESLKQRFENTQYGPQITDRYDVAVNNKTKLADAKTALDKIAADL